MSVPLKQISADIATFGRLQVSVRVPIYHQRANVEARAVTESNGYVNYTMPPTITLRIKTYQTYSQDDNVGLTTRDKDALYYGLTDITDKILSRNDIFKKHRDKDGVEVLYVSDKTVKLGIQFRFSDVLIYPGIFGEGDYFDNSLNGEPGIRLAFNNCQSGCIITLTDAKILCKLLDKIDPFLYGNVIYNNYLLQLGSATKPAPYPKNNTRMNVFKAETKSEVVSTGTKVVPETNNNMEGL